MAEHGLRGPVIGVSFDGTGYGTDGAIWGGEILISEGADYERFSHLKYIDIIGGDESMKDAWKSAVSYLYAERAGKENALTITGPAQTEQPQAGSAEAGPSRPGPAQPDPAQPGASQTYLSQKKPAQAGSYPRSASLSTGKLDESAEFEIDLSPLVAYSEQRQTFTEARPREEYETALAALKTGENTVRTSSMGRLFDAACAMLGLQVENRYEGECAIMLENAAFRAIKKESFGEKPTEQERLALCFHTEIAKTILAQCREARTQKNIQKVCLSGGVFQNKILTEETLRLLRADCFNVYYNIHVPPNDGGLSLGQNYIGMLSLCR